MVYVRLPLAPRPQVFVNGIERLLQVAAEHAEPRAVERRTVPLRCGIRLAVHVKIQRGGRRDLRTVLVAVLGIDEAVHLAGGVRLREVFEVAALVFVGTFVAVVDAPAGRHRARL